MDRIRVYRGLRIAWSVGFGTLCHLLLVLWIRSYWTADIISWNANFLASNRGTASLTEAQMLPAPSLVGYFGMSVSLPTGWNYRSCPAYFSSPSDPGVLATLGVQSNTRITVAYWLLIAFIAALAYVPWFPWSTRFGLKTLFMLTTALAILLGLVVWRTRG